MTSEIDKAVDELAADRARLKQLNEQCAELKHAVQTKKRKLQQMPGYEAVKRRRTEKKEAGECDKWIQDYDLQPLAPDDVADDPVSRMRAAVVTELKTPGVIDALQRKVEGLTDILMIEYTHVPSNLRVYADHASDYAEAHKPHCLKSRLAGMGCGCESMLVEFDKITEADLDDHKKVPVWARLAVMVMKSW